MSSNKVYEDLYDPLSRAGGAIPAVPSEELLALLKAIITEEEAELAAKIPGKPITAEALAAQTGKSTEDVAAKLESMADNGFLHAQKNPEDHYEYSILPLLPGVYEAQFFRGTKTDRDYRIAHLFKDYTDAITKLRDSLPTPPPEPSTSFFRVLPIEEEIESSSKVLSYAQLSKYVEQTEAIAVGTCFCRHHAILLDENNNCGVSHKNCMAFGDGAIFVSERHNGRIVSKGEALEILKNAEEDGLVHCSANTSDALAFICNCCSCHCGILRMAKAASHASSVLTSGYHARFDSEVCTACETCMDRCPVSAIDMDEAASVDTLQCIGCGLCVSTCPTGAIDLVVKSDAINPPGTMGALDSAMKEG